MAVLARNCSSFDQRQHVEHDVKQRGDDGDGDRGGGAGAHLHRDDVGRGPTMGLIGWGDDLFGDDDDEDDDDELMMN